MRFKIGDRPYYFAILRQRPMQLLITGIDENNKQYIDEWGVYWNEDSLYATKEDAEWDNTDHQHF